MSQFELATIFIIDDNEVERRLVKRSLKKGKFANPVKEAENGEEALQMLENNEVPKPFIILLRYQNATNEWP